MYQKLAPSPLREPPEVQGGSALHAEAKSGAVVSSVTSLDFSLGTMSGRHFAAGASTPK